ncbi:MAG: hypothetical protein EBU90_07105 [Proteobacteria bacterium]|nr:hypothetical protein [Pseudomonadota bacterium]NBP14182.1 hypothetical protein [bacterium]
MFLDHFFQPDPHLVFEIPWNDDPFSYDEELYDLGQGHREFVILNPRIDTKDLFYVNEIPRTDKCLVWHNGETWLAKYFRKGWRPYKGYQEIRIEPTEIVWSWNPDIDKLMQFEEDIYTTFQPDPWDRQFKLVWYIDNRFNPLEENVWAFSCQPKGKVDPIRKEMGFVTPKVNVEYNKDLPRLFLDIDQCYPPFWELVNECAYQLDNKFAPEDPIWVVKFSPSYRKPREWKWLGVIEPQFEIEYNTEISKLNYDILPYHKWFDLEYQHVYFLDRAYLQNNEPDIWVLKLRYTEEPSGDKDQGYIHPKFKIVKNPNLPDLNYDVEYVPPYHDLAFEHIWMLDSSLTSNSPEPIWAFKAISAKKSKGSKIVGEVYPKTYIEINQDLSPYRFSSPQFPLDYHDLGYLHVWYVNSKLVEQSGIWALSLSFVEECQGFKEYGEIDPDFTFKKNPALSGITYEIDYKIPLIDAQYEHIWYLEKENKKIWAAKLSATETPTGTKEVGLVIPEIAKTLDVFFISYNESNAEKNWKHLKKLVPWAQRVDGVKGIFEAHKQAAMLSSTDMFYVVDADARVLPDFDFAFNPDLFDRKFVYIWKSKNPFNDLEYGYGGVKLFPKKLFQNKKTWNQLDVTTTLAKGLKVIEKTSNITEFNTDKFSTWRSAFREAVKLSENKNYKALKNWVTKLDAKYADQALKGIEDGKKYYSINKDHKKNLLLINDRDWLEQKFKEQNVRYEPRKNTKSNTNNQ